ncbi:hypothetical protein BKA57DRAFT_451003 [Linnemannia elongata]|nr:hypothetical protein BGZ88_012310 [Linnemannia elongata]KAH7056626.1 hypothetical protein BKA57DRAFT_451003 [Linnemannia elongata]KAK5823234.1 hypothetical protein F5H01DRAFT_333901 [Linnemannia elongata]
MPSQSSSSTRRGFTSTMLLALTTLLLGTTLLSTSLTEAHSWVDCVKTLPSGKCAGYPTNYPTRANGDINTIYTYLISSRNNAAPLCKPGTQDTFLLNKDKANHQPPNLPFAQAYPGETLTMNWEANGHLVRTGKGTKVTIFWTGKSNKVLKTRKDIASGRNGLGKALAVFDFANPGNCKDPNNANTECTGKFTIPKDTAPGRYQFVWWWPFDKNPVGEEYTTCFEVNVVAKPKPKA